MATSEKLKADIRKSRRNEGPVQASLRNLPMSARKIRVLADEIRGQKVERALQFLAVQRKACARPLKKLLESAVANASERKMDFDELSIASLLVHKGPLRKRFMPRAHGRATRIRKQTAHIEVILG